jgi:DNA-3-methyladenine glycosylase II
VCFNVRKITNHLKKDPVLGPIVQSVGPYRITFRDPTFSALVGSIVSQQLSTKVARVIFARLVAAMPENELTPENILKLRPARMRTLGLSARKVEYIRDIARHTRNGTLDFASLPSMNDEAVIECLTKVKGVGVWTAHMFLLFALQRPNILAVGDLGIRSAIKKAYQLDHLPTAQEVEELAVHWRPYCSAACWYLWKSLDGPAGAI